MKNEEKKVAAIRPKRRTLIEKAQRGVIVDRFNRPLALNRIRYNAAIYYGEIAQLPTLKWETTDKGKIKRYVRREYIEELSQCLAKELGLEAQYVEDLIHSKASLFPHVPFILQENISEKTYYKLRMLEKNWVGLHAEISSERYYPQKEYGAEVIGYMGAINQNEFLKVAQELDQLKSFFEQYEKEQTTEMPLPYTSIEQMFERYRELKEKAYTYQDQVGKAGIEAKFESKLRGSYGKKLYEVDVKGNFLKALSGSKKPISGQNIQLTLSIELQKFAQELLYENEKTRDQTKKDLEKSLYKKPWIKGGCIIAMDPNNGEIIALASSPSFDPNDFILSSRTCLQKEKKRNVHKWLETKNYLADIWDGKEKLNRKIYDSSQRKYIQENVDLSWGVFLDFILPYNCDIKKALDKISNVQNAVFLQEDVEGIKYFFDHKDVKVLFDFLFHEADHHIPTQKQIPLLLKEKLLRRLKKYPLEISRLKNNITLFLSDVSNNLDKLCVVDLCRLAVFSPAFSNGLIKEIGHLSLGKYRTIVRDTNLFQCELKQNVFKHWEETEFQKWRKDYFKSFLKEKRTEEKNAKTYARPYLQYLNEKKEEMFEKYWQKNSSAFLVNFFEKPSSSFFQDLQKGKKPLFDFMQKLSKPLIMDFLNTARSFDQLDRPLFSSYRRIKKKSPLEKDLAACFYPQEGFGFIRSTAFQEYTPLGSIFKLVTAYEALKQRFEKTPHALNPLTMIDMVKYHDKHNLAVGYTIDNKPIFRIYKKGRLPKSYRKNIGKIDLISAIEQTSNPYFSLLAADHIKDPEDLNAAARFFGFGRKTGIDLPGEKKGNLPHDLQNNPTGLYSYAIGQHTLIVTPLQTARFFSTLANGKTLMYPQIIQKIYPRNFHTDRSAFFKKELETLGIFFPVFSFQNSSINMSIQNQFAQNTDIRFPEKIRTFLLNGMQKVVNGKKGTARAFVIKGLYGKPFLMKDYKTFSKKMVGKTSTAEFVYNPSVAPSSKGQIFKHTWFASILFSEPFPSHQKFDHPELVVVVFLKYGNWGKEAAPIAMQIMKKYLEIKKRHSYEQVLSSSKERI